MLDKAVIEWRRLIAEHGPPTGCTRVRLGTDTLAAAVAEGRALHLDRRSDGFGGGEMLIRLARAGDDPLSCVVFARPCTLTQESIDLLNKNSWERPSDMPWVVYPELTGEDARRAALANEAERRGGKR